jgi:hypothetical protein
MPIGQEDKGFQQFDWWRAKVFILDLHTRGHQTTAFKTPIWQHFLGILAPRIYPMDESLSAMLMEIPTFLKHANFLFKFIQSPKKLYFNGLLPCHL